jgi:hypothetical protein
MTRMSGGCSDYLAVVTRNVTILVLIALVNVGYPVLGQESAPTEITETFDRGEFDRMRWFLSNTSVAVTQVDFSRKKMRLIVPPGPDKRPLMGLDSRFGVEGDFDISVDYSIRSLPKPEKEWVNLSIFIIGPDGMAAMTRTHNSKSGQGYSMWFQPSEGSKAKGSARDVSTQDKTGTLRLARVGKELRYYAAATGQPQKEIGIVDFGDRPIDKVAFQVFTPASKAPIDIEFDNMTVKADRFTKLVYVPPSGNAALFWILSGLAALALIWLAAWWIFRRAR